MGTRKEMNMSRKLIIDGNAVYEIDEQCMRDENWKKMPRRQKAAVRTKKGRQIKI